MSLSSLHEKLAAHPDRRMRVLYLDGTLVSRSYAEMNADVAVLMAELCSCGVVAGDLVGLLGPNSYEWAIADLALLGLRCIPVALSADPTVGAADVADMAQRYRLSAVLITRAARPGAELPPMAAVLEARPLSFQAKPPAPQVKPRLPDDVCTIAFSSGTSGTKKGLMMSEAGIINTITTSGEAWRVSADDNVLIVMPFSNFQQRYLLYLAIWYGCDATVVAPERMFQKLRELQPTIILGPPSFFEIVRNRVQAGNWRDKLRYRAAAILSLVAPGRLTERLRARLGRRWLAMYGPRARLMLTGSAPVPPDVVRLFRRLGAPLFEVYGSTEIGWICFNLPQAHRSGTAGRPVSGVTVTLAGDGEVVVASAHPQTVGYIFAGEETRASVYLPDGRIATGDLGRLERSGFFRLVGRKKNVIITRSGVKINPEELEQDIEKGSRVTRAMIASPGSAGLLVCVAWLSARDAEAEVDAFIADLNDRNELARKISQVIFRPDTELTVASGLLTRNFKIDRNAVMSKVFTEHAEAVK